MSALYRISEKPGLRQSLTINRFYHSHLIFQNFSDGIFFDLPDYRIPEIQARHQRVGLNADMPLAGDDLALRHPLPTELFDQNSDLVVAYKKDAPEKKEVQKK